MYHTQIDEISLLVHANSCNAENLQIWPPRENSGFWKRGEEEEGVNCPTDVLDIFIELLELLHYRTLNWLYDRKLHEIIKQVKD